MGEDIYSQKLAWFKQNEKPEVVLLVADDQERIKLVLAWTNVEVKPVPKLTHLKSESDNDVWKWLWENTRYSKTELMEKSGLSLSDSALDTKIKPLIGNRIIYPDGTINSFVQRYLREQVLKRFAAKPKQRSKSD